MRVASSIWYPVAAAVAFHLALLAMYLPAFHGDLSSLVCVGQERIGAPPFEAVRVGFVTGGFDGQFYYAIARNPWTWHRAELDVPAYRHVRLLYPALAWALSGGGNPYRLFWAQRGPPPTTGRDCANARPTASSPTIRTRRR